MTSRSEHRRHPRLPLVLVPWLIYLSVTVVAPALRGGASQPGFWAHVAITVGVSGVLLSFCVVAGRGARLLTRSKPWRARRPSGSTVPRC